ncbi:MAG: hypothetical protein DRQ64_10620 [Gammaproteobacteria bacterium]|nr:MAG: hypothetical protein DRQ64_10620 [Gammaproteobacteria bacterium]
MSDDNNDDNQENNSDNSNDTNTDTSTSTEPTMEELVAQQVAEEIKGIKNKLDNAYGARDEAQAKVAEFELAATKAETERLKAEGNHKEAYELELSQEKAKIKALQDDNVKLSRDIEVKNLLNHYEFKSENANEMAYNVLVNNLIKDDNGNWVSKTGKPMTEHVSEFMSSDENSFLLRPKVNSGSQETHHKSSTPDNKSLFELSQDEVIKRVSEGKL